MSDRPSTPTTPRDEEGTARFKEDKHRIEELFADLEAAITQADAARFDAPFAADVVFTAVDGARFVGWKALHAYHRERLSTPTDAITTWYELEHITFPAPDVAVVALRQPIEVAGTRRANVGTWTLIRRNGSWWVSAAQNTGVAEGA
ncbi:SgcJ/EcaC family oxidoreductase [Streptomyces sp. NPDC007083]|uniref:SgcJ/EcaC family oxidoreductase n=1 Tax=unclassified Streptomyces TaxID=2593676 RepID=UPI0034009CDA